MEGKVTWVGPGLRMLGESGSGPAFAVDHVMDDEDRPTAGPTPMELVLMALAGCTGMDVLSIMKKQRQPLTGFEVTARGERAEEHPRVYTHIEIEYLITGEGLDPEGIVRAIELSETKYCSVAAMLGETVEIETAHRIEDA